MNLLLLSNLFPPRVIGGYELLAADVAEGLRARGHTVTVATSGDGDSTGDVVRSLSLSRPFGDAAARDRLRHLVAAHRNRRAIAEIVAERGPFDAALAMSLRRLGLSLVRALEAMRTPVVLTVNDDWPVGHVAQRPSASLRGMAASVLDRLPFVEHTFRGVRSRRVVYLSRAIRDRVLGAGAPLPHSGRVQAQGVDLCRFETRAFAPVAKRPRLLLVGRLHPSKAPDVAIEAIGELRARGCEATLTLAGAAVDRAYQTELEATAARAGVAGAVTFMGAVPRERLPALYRGADIALFLTRWDGEGQGLTHLEAMACGVPVVAHALGGAAELLEGSGAATLADACTASSLADAVLRLCIDQHMQREQVACGLQLVTTRASLDAYVEALEAELRAAANERAGR